VRGSDHGIGVLIGNVTRHKPKNGVPDGHFSRHIGDFSDSTSIMP